MVCGYKSSSWDHLWSCSFQWHNLASFYSSLVEISANQICGSIGLGSVGNKYTDPDVICLRTPGQYCLDMDCGIRGLSKFLFNFYLSLFFIVH